MLKVCISRDTGGGRRSVDPGAAGRREGAPQGRDAPRQLHPPQQKAESQGRGGTQCLPRLPVQSPQPLRRPPGGPFQSLRSQDFFHASSPPSTIIVQAGRQKLSSSVAGRGNRKKNIELPPLLS